MKSFKTKQVKVRKFELTDIEQAYYNLSIYDDFKNVSEDAFNSNMSKTKLVIKSAINEYYTDEPVWAVEKCDNKQLIGYVRVSNYSEKNKMCNITWSMSNGLWDAYAMKEALIEVMNFLFNKKNIELIECSYYGQVKKYEEILNSVGMIKEAILRNRRINSKTNEKENFVIYSIVKQEFFEKNLHKKLL